jgi:hypothetical protein
MMSITLINPNSTTTASPRTFELCGPAGLRGLAAAELGSGCESGLAGMATAGGEGAAGAEGGVLRASEGNTGPAVFQSGQPSRHTSESALTRPSAIHLRIISPLAGPNCPPEGGRTYHTEFGASAIGSEGKPAATTEVATAEPTGVATAGLTGTACATAAAAGATAGRAVTGCAAGTALVAGIDWGVAIVV